MVATSATPSSRAYLIALSITAIAAAGLCPAEAHAQAQPPPQPTGPKQKLGPVWQKAATTWQRQAAAVGAALGQVPAALRQVPTALQQVPKVLREKTTAVLASRKENAARKAARKAMDNAVVDASRELQNAEPFYRATFDGAKKAASPRGWQTLIHVICGVGGVSLAHDSLPFLFTPLWGVSAMLAAASVAMITTGVAAETIGYRDANLAGHRAVVMEAAGRDKLNPLAEAWVRGAILRKIEGTRGAIDAQEKNIDQIVRDIQ